MQTLGLVTDKLRSVVCDTNVLLSSASLAATDRFYDALGNLGNCPIQEESEVKLSP
jgi:hypothetical protein